MTTEEDKELLEIIREARNKARGYADFFGWGADRDIEEWGVVTSLVESLKADGVTLFTSLERRGRPNDPPDCEALDTDGNRVAIEVTELVDGKAIQAYKAGKIYEWADWDQDKFTSSLEALISRKDSRFNELKGAPYEGGYVIVIFTDEPILNRIAVESFLRGCNIKKPKNITRTFLLVSYDPSIKKCPYYELQFHG
ncbi:hypothetical protein [Pseudomonas subflava]|uniref:hypothetical protein n=1 Tax=Pseudomonas subflava TaxID=2952933 RepID=UPI00207AB746|nr:hypothetical protein [Pseudomonas subflava]